MFVSFKIEIWYLFIWNGGNISSFSIIPELDLKFLKRSFQFIFSLGLKYKLEAKDMDIKELKKLVKMKQDELSEMQVGQLH